MERTLQALLFLSLTQLSGSGAAGEHAGAERVLLLQAPAQLCEHAQINGRVVPRESSGVFAPIPLTAGTVHLQCGASLTLAIREPFDASMTVTLDSAGQPTFTGAHAALNSLLNTSLALSLRALYPYLRRSDTALTGTRERLQRADTQRLTQLAVLGLDSELLARESARVAFNYAQVRVMLPFFRWRESDQDAIVFDPELPALTGALPLRDPRWWTLPEFSAFAEAWIHETARTLLITQATYRSGDHRWLRASLAAIEQRFPDAQLRTTLRDTLILRHLDQDSSTGMASILNDWRPRAQPDMQAKADALLAQEPAEDQAKFVYQTLAGVPLHVHFLQPAEPPGNRMPAMLWFHGGSSTQGAWWHMPVIAKALLEQGVAVISVELSTQNRFDSDSDQLRDADLAWQWLKENAARLNLDPQKLGVAGFSSGASLALTGATRGFDMGQERREWPALAIVMGACADPLADEEDGWFRKSMARHGDPAQFTPMGNIRANLPPVLAIHGTADEYCSYVTLQAFAQRSRTQGNAVEVIGIDGARHFFGFYHRAGIAAAREAIGKQLQLRQWTASTPRATPQQQD